MRIRTAGVATLSVFAVLATAPVALAASPRASLAAGPQAGLHPAFTNPGTAEPSLSLSVSPTGEPEVASVGKGDSLWFTYKQGSKWHRHEVAKAGAAQSGPSLLAMPDGGAGLAVEGPHHTLQYYLLANGHWYPKQLAGKNTTYSAPSLVQGPEGLGLAVQGRNHTLWYYSTSSDHWSKRQVSGSGIAYSAPSLVVRAAAQATTADPAGEVDIAVQNADHSLSYWRRLSGGWDNDVLSGAGTTFSAPSMVVVGGSPTRTLNYGNALIYFEGPSHELMGCVSTNACKPLEGKRWDYAAPSLVQGDAYTWLPVAFQNSDHSLTVEYLNLAGPRTGSGQNAPVAGGLTTYSAPAIYVLSNGHTDMVVQGPRDSLLYYQAPIPPSGKVLAFTKKKTIAGPGTTFGG